MIVIILITFGDEDDEDDDCNRNCRASHSSGFLFSFLNNDIGDNCNETYTGRRTHRVLHSLLPASSRGTHLQLLCIPNIITL